MQRVHGDNPKALTKRKELDVHLALSAAGLFFEYQKHLPFKNCGLASETVCCYIDFAIPMPWGVVLLECDEEQHRGHESASCDVRRDFDAAASVALGSQQKLAVLRFNPDAFQIAGVTQRAAKKDRLAKLLATLAAWQAVDPAPELGFARFFLFYDAASEDAALPSVAEDWDPLAREVSFRVR